MSKGYGKFVATGNVGASERDIIWVPNRKDRAGLPALVFCHGAGAPDMGTRYTWPNHSIMMAAFAEAGFVCVAGWFGSTLTTDPWANDTAMTRITAALAYAASKGGASASKMHLMGVSHGGSMIARYAEQNPAKVSSLTGIIPFLDTKHEYLTNTHGFQAGIGTAWGIATNGTGTLPTSADVLGNAAAIKTAGIPSRLFYSTYDAFIDTATVAAFATAAGATAVSIDTLGTGHADGTVKQLANWASGSNYSALIAALKAAG